VFVARISADRVAPNEYLQIETSPIDTNLRKCGKFTAEQCTEACRV